jgi:hypothetical protein
MEENLEDLVSAAKTIVETVGEKWFGDDRGPVSYRYNVDGLFIEYFIDLGGGELEIRYKGDLLYFKSRSGETFVNDKIFGSEISDIIYAKGAKTILLQ